MLDASCSCCEDRAKARILSTTVVKNKRFKSGFVTTIVICQKKSRQHFSPGNYQESIASE